MFDIWRKYHSELPICILIGLTEIQIIFWPGAELSHTSSLVMLRDLVLHPLILVSPETGGPPEYRHQQSDHGVIDLQEAVEGSSFMIL